MEEAKQDGEGNLRCWNCGGDRFRSKRTGLGVPVHRDSLSADSLGRKLKCHACDTVNVIGHLAEPMEAREATATVPDSMEGATGHAAESKGRLLSRLGGLLGMLRPTRQGLMSGHKPLGPELRLRDVTDKIADAFLGESLEVRNRLANAALAWAEQEGPETFERLRHVIIQAELATNAKDWVKRFPEETVDSANAKQVAALIVVLTELAGRSIGSYEQQLGPDIPLILGKVYRRLVEVKSG